MSGHEYRVDLEDPRAPSVAQWEAMSEAERAVVVQSLPSEIERATPPGGDAHTHAKYRAREMLDQHFRRIRREVYLASEMAVYYPEERMFAPDLIAIFDVALHPRESWVVSHEGRGLDFVLEVHVSGDAKKDFVTNVERLARLGVPEYFVFEPPRQRLRGWRLPSADDRVFEPIMPQLGHWPSAVLGLELGVERGRLRFFYGGVPLPDARELIERLEGHVDEVVRRAEEEARRAEEEARRAEQETRRAEQETRRAERLAAKLRELGVEPDEL